MRFFCLPILAKEVRIYARNKRTEFGVWNFDVRNHGLRNGSVQCSAEKRRFVAGPVSRVLLRLIFAKKNFESGNRLYMSATAE